jgi:hypothetical protein
MPLLMFSDYKLSCFEDPFQTIKMLFRLKNNENLKKWILCFIIIKLYFLSQTTYQWIYSSNYLSLIKLVLKDLIYLIIMFILETFSNQIIFKTSLQLCDSS